MTEVSYPSNVMVNFRKLTTRALLQYCSHHNISGIPPEFSQSQLANIVAQHFSSWKLNEDKAIKSFCSTAGLSWNGKVLGHLSSAKPRGLGDTKREQGSQNQSHPKKRRRPPTTAAPSQATKRPRDRVPDPARRGEQVAAHMSSTDENGSWILARVVEFNVAKQVYTVQDEDDVTKVMDLDHNRVLRLNDGSTHFSKGDAVLAMFPETTSFYRGLVHKPANTDNMLQIRFEDDEDGQGRTPSRHIPSRFVLRLPSADHIDDRLPSTASRPASSHFKHASSGLGSHPLHSGAPKRKPVGSQQAELHAHRPLQNLNTHQSTRAHPYHTHSTGTHNKLPGAAAARPYAQPPRPHMGTGKPSHKGSTGGGGVGSGNKPAAEITYSDMITHTLNQLPDRRGTFKEICGLIEKQFTKQLNWKLESSAMRKTPVWKSSVRKILFSNKNFAHADGSDRRENIFTFAYLTSQKK
uniref:SGF29 C-terminal domain-containing protein n=1 Tax=Heterosigma akashiwo TaxID=2829 RepID=A0A7S3XKW5_HETAK